MTHLHDFCRRSANVGFVVDKMILEEILLGVHTFSLVSITPPVLNAHI